ncbi:MurR/RpiR family transcriptional regulator [Rhodococcus triatomae]|uniref:DNA-binding transcriptional regulator, MurR/RpiR family, contains HTH and SIS domains n=1 Tax=Rhodococcus triatomae TaxID=300028 RepID=A0A1G8GSV0_9NOCA|nr:MurR/RpiR family transcriptional regulator [Rhodococcus triatomae]QNG20305.1 MurR/RpiR family transcriptional regulator [Rhodococcus triatomae]QNG23779.1 MurR/RpiR family transcriptional regulator [Rhodococcus triatomae]SDH97457.1 DNA-binding transcriptional regulator, MurR/RpiR family, contains HTH and SIS domains [Rhodococcus triatomae]
MSTTTDHPKPSPTLAVVRAALPTLGPSEQRVARTILARPREISDFSTADLASASGTSQATVVRACQRLGFRGYQHLRLELARIPATEDRQTGSPVDEAFSAASTALTATRNAVDESAFDATVERLVHAGRVLMVGNGFSSPPIQDAALRFTTIGRTVEAPLDILAQQFSSRLLTGSDLCLAVSYSGANTHTLRACAAARDQGATVVAVTSYSHSPLARLSDHLLWAGAGLLEHEADSFGCRISQSAILYALWRATLAHPAALPAARTADSGAREVVADALSDEGTER